MQILANWGKSGVWGRADNSRRKEYTMIEPFFSSLSVLSANSGEPFFTRAFYLLQEVAGLLNSLH
jgi:hypothetical protein